MNSVFAQKICAAKPVLPFHVGGTEDYGGFWKNCPLGTPSPLFSFRWCFPLLLLSILKAFKYVYHFFIYENCPAQTCIDISFMLGLLRIDFLPGHNFVLDPFCKAMMVKPLNVQNNFPSLEMPTLFRLPLSRPSLVVWYSIAVLRVLQA